MNTLVISSIRPDAFNIAMNFAVIIDFEKRFGKPFGMDFDYKSNMIGTLYSVLHANNKDFSMDFDTFIATVQFSDLLRFASVFAPLVSEFFDVKEEAPAENGKN